LSRKLGTLACVVRDLAPAPRRIVGRNMNPPLPSQAAPFPLIFTPRALAVRFFNQVTTSVTLVIQAHQGRVEVITNSSGGSRFSLYLPLSPAV
jgi:hypothetical protein